MASSDINLLQTKTDLHPALAVVERYIRVVSIGITMVVVITGILLAFAFFLLTRKRDDLRSQQQQARTQIESNVAKESLLFLVRDRLTAIGTMLPTERSFAPFIDTTLAVIGSNTLTSFALGANNTVNMTMTVRSIPDALQVVKTVMDLNDKHVITNPVLATFTMSNDGVFTLGLSYTVVL